MSQAQTPKPSTDKVSGTPQTNGLISSLGDLQLTLDQAKDQSALTGSGREVSLQRELDQLTKINDTITNISQSLDVTDTSLNRMISHTEQSNELLNVWIKILSQNHHTYGLLKDKENWKGRTDFVLNHEAKLEHLEALDSKLEQLKAQEKKIEESRRAREEERAALASKKDKRLYRV